ncbi:MAG: tol-pal system protein YbgF [Gammaproteobacteria bacterium]|nr:tol-pal system protein YbgF [Gammaproteobacteria bacterium]
MMTSSLKQGFLVAMLTSCIAMNAFAEDAPVYDVDTYPPQFDGQQPETSAVPPPDNLGGPAPMGPQGPRGEPPRPMAGPDQDLSPSPVQLTLAQRVGRLEQQINNMLHSDSTPKMADMQSQLQALRGQVEDLTHQLQELQTQQKKAYADLDKRLSQKGSSSAAVAPSAVDDSDMGSTPADSIAKTKSSASAKAAAAKTVGQPNVAEEQQIYQTAYNLIKAKKYNDAAATLQNMLQKYPSGQFAGNAHYWLGQLYSLMGKNDQAVTEFGNVVKNYPDYPKAADAQLKLGLAYSTLMKWSDAKSAFKAVINHYPGTTSAHLASEQLKQIKISGH